MPGSITSIFLLTLLVPLAFLPASNIPQLYAETNDWLYSWEIHQEHVKKAEFPGGRKAIGEYLDHHITIPEIAFKMKGRKEILMGGDIVVEIKADGTPQFLEFSNHRILPDHPAVAEEVKKEFTRVIESMTKWTPAMKNGKPFPSKETLQYIVGGYEQTTYQEYKQLQEENKAKKPAKTFSFSDLKTRDGSQIYSFVQEPPKFPGGDKALKAFLLNNLTYLQRTGIEKKGQTIILGIIVTKEGIAEDLVVIHPVGDPSFDHKQAQETLKRMPAWKPGKQNKMPIAVGYTLPFSF